MSDFFVDKSAPYITGNGFALRCESWFPWEESDPDRLGQNPARRNQCVYVKADFVHRFFASRCVPDYFTIVTHNSDVSIGNEHRRYLDDPRVGLWLAQNVEIEHPKLKPIPIGIANRNYAHGDTDTLRGVQAERLTKIEMFYANYRPGTAVTDVRWRCLNETRIPLAPPKTFGEYLRDLSRARFCIAPAGRGVDTHRVWEALYVRTIPVVVDSPVYREHSDFPMVILNDWSDFKSVEWSSDMYEKIWNNFDPKSLEMERYCERLRTRYGSRL